MITWPQGNRTDFLLYECETAPVFEIAPSVFLFKNKITKYAALQIPANSLAIVDTVNQPALSMLQRSSVSAVTCGMSPRDTLTLSSSKERSAAVCIQRQMQTMAGQTVDEREIPVHFERRYEPYTLLSICALLILAGQSTGWCTGIAVIVLGYCVNWLRCWN